MNQTEILIAEQLLLQGLAFWTEFQKRKTAGVLTQADLDQAMQMLDTDIDQLKLSIQSQAGG